MKLMTQKFTVRLNFVRFKKPIRHLKDRNWCF